MYLCNIHCMYVIMHCLVARVFVARGGHPGSGGQVPAPNPYEELRPKTPGRRSLLAPPLQRASRNCHKGPKPLGNWPRASSSARSGASSHTVRDVPEILLDFSICISFNIPLSYNYLPLIYLLYTSWIT
jgi:hypothetical protein